MSRSRGGVTVGSEFTTSGKPVAVILREGKTPASVEVRTILKHVIGRIRGHWPKVRILVRGDSHYGRVEAMEWCEEQGVHYIFGFGSLIPAGFPNSGLGRATH